MVNFPLPLPAKPIILASSSPRRRQLLAQIGLKFHVQASHANEEVAEDLSPVAIVKELATRKAAEVARQHREALVIGADTIVVLDDRILGKPDSPAAAGEMLATLSGRGHQVYTGFAIIDQPSDRIRVEAEMTNVSFRRLERAEIEAYIATGEAFDKAGAYGIQDFSAVFSDRIEGCFYNVVGFPLTKFYLAFKNFLQEIDGRQGG